MKGLNSYNFLIIECMNKNKKLVKTNNENIAHIP